MKCEHDDKNILLTKCESGNCGKWMEKFKLLHQSLCSIVGSDKQISFTRFEYQKTQEYGSRLVHLTSPLNLDAIFSFLHKSLPNYVVHSNRNLKDIIKWKIIKQNVVSESSSLITLDYSENISIPVQHEPQSMYWIRKAVSIMTLITETVGGKEYHGHVSEDRDHDPVFTRESLVSVIKSIPHLDYYFI